MVTLRDQLPDARLIELAGSLHDTDHIEIGPLGRQDLRTLLLELFERRRKDSTMVAL